MQRRDAAVVLFTLDPEAEGQRKRLGLPAPARASLFRALIEHVVEVVSATSGVDLLVASPRRPPVEKGRFIGQRGREPGDSLRLAVDDAFRLGYRRVVVVGNDSPDLSTRKLREAFRSLERGPRSAVIAPAIDGGYALLGLTAPCPAAFDEPAWGARDVAARAAETLLRSGFTLEHLTTLEDIDGSRSLLRWLERARKSSRYGASPLVRRIGALLLPERPARADSPDPPLTRRARSASSPRAPPRSP